MFIGIRLISERILKKSTGSNGVRRYWLFKSEPSAFGIEHLVKSARQTAPWDGVRNYQARNFLRDDVQVGDRVLFYHSREEPLGIFGTMEVVPKIPSGSSRLW